MGVTELDWDHHRAPSALPCVRRVGEWVRLTHLHGLWLYLLHTERDDDLLGVGRVLPRLDVHILQQAARIDVVDGVITVLHLVVVSALQGEGRDQGVEGASLKIHPHDVGVVGGLFGFH